MAEFFDFRTLGGPKNSRAENFELLCAQLIDAEYDETSHVRCHPGDEGKDIVIGPIDEPRCVFQCKYFIDGLGKSQRDQIRRSYWRADHPKKWVLCLPVDLSPDEQRWFRSLASYNDEFWGETRLLNLLCKHPRIGMAFFDLSVSRKIDEIHQSVFGSGKPVSDETVLEWLYIFFDRPAFQVTFEFECDLSHFDKAMQDTVAALNTGVLQTRDGHLIGRTKPKDQVSTRRWRDGLNQACQIVSEIRQCYANALRREVIVLKDRPVFNWKTSSDLNHSAGRSLIHYMNSARNQVLKIMNDLFQEIGKPPLDLIPETRDGWIDACWRRFD